MTMNQIKKWLASFIVFISMTLFKLETVYAATTNGGIKFIKDTSTTPSVPKPPSPGKPSLPGGKLPQMGELLQNKLVLSIGLFFLLLGIVLIVKNKNKKNITN